MAVVSVTCTTSEKGVACVSKLIRLKLRLPATTILSLGIIKPVGSGERLYWRMVLPLRLRLPLMGMTLCPNPVPGVILVVGVVPMALVTVSTLPMTEPKPPKY